MPMPASGRPGLNWVKPSRNAPNGEPVGMLLAWICQPVPISGRVTPASASGRMSVAAVRKVPGSAARRVADQHAVAQRAHADAAEVDVAVAAVELELHGAGVRGGGAAEVPD